MGLIPLGRAGLTTTHKNLGTSDMSSSGVGRTGTGAQEMMTQPTTDGTKPMVSDAKGLSSSTRVTRSQGTAAGLGLDSDRSGLEGKGSNKLNQETTSHTS